MIEKPVLAPGKSCIRDMFEDIHLRVFHGTNLPKMASIPANTVARYTTSDL